MILKIVEPFWGAWKVYGWEKPIPGIGINLKTVEAAHREGRKIQIKIGKDQTLYEISPVTVNNLVNQYNSLRSVRAGVKVAVIPQNKLTKVAPPADLADGQVALILE